MVLVKINRRDVGHGRHAASEFTVFHPSLKSRALFILLLPIVVILAFSFGLHLLDKNILAATCLVLVISLLFKLYTKVHSEIVLLLPSLGLQVETHYYLGHTDTRFIHISHIQDIVISEAVTMHSILYYLVILLKGKEGSGLQGLYPLFTHSWPPLSSLKPVYRACQEKLIR